MEKTPIWDFKHKQCNLLEMFENSTTTLKHEIKSKGMYFTYPVGFEKYVNLKASGFLDTIETPIDWCDKQCEKIELCQLGAGVSNFNGCVTQRGRDISFVCFHCGLTTNYNSNLDRQAVIHDKRDRKLFSCTYCDHLTDYKCALVQQKTNINSGRYEKHSCTHCGKDLNNKQTLDDHVIRYHQNFIGSVSSKVHSCPTCNYKTTIKSNLKYHTVVHSQNYEKYKCKGCEKCFKHKISLDNHILKKHQNLINLVSSKIHNCPKCEYKTTIITDLKCHMVKAHSGNYKTYLCRGCEKDFRSKQALDNHIMKKHQNFLDSARVKVHNCPTCSYTTIIKSDLRRHMVNVHLGNYMKYFCKGCEKHFKSKQTLDDHIIKNHQNLVGSVSSKIHSCQTCNYKTTNSSFLREHIGKVHTGNYQKHSCKCCKRYFRSKLSLDDHIIKNHQSFIYLVSRKVHNCMMCDYKTTQTTLLKRHVRAAHSECY